LAFSNVGAYLGISRLGFYFEKKEKKISKKEEMSFSHFPQYEHELFWSYYDRLHALLAHCDFHLEKWEILNAVYEGVNCETRTLLEYWNFCAKNVDKTWDFLNWLAQDTYEYEISCADSYIPPPCIPGYAPPMCKICH